MSFYTEKQVEEMLITETRELPMPDGSVRQHTDFHLMWNTLDYLMGNYEIDLEWFVNLGLMHAEESNLPFDKAFANMVGYVRHRYDIKDGYK